jgi:DNA-binding NtrC family response regulator
MITSSKGRILVAVDDPNVIGVLPAILSGDGHDVLSFRTVEHASRAIDNNDIDAVISDIQFPDGDGLEFFEYVTATRPDIPVLFLAAHEAVESAVAALSRGAFYYFVKPPDYPKLKSLLARAVEQRRLKRELDFLRNRFFDEAYGNRIIGNSPEIQKMRDKIRAVKDSSNNVLICGETGTGKELIARALHDTGATSNGSFVAVNCAAIPKELIEAELFGCEKGAFTGAVARRIGKFEEAASGVIFLDEIGELELSMQAKLLRVLQEREIERIGSNKKIKVGFRLISATNGDLLEGVKKGSFREDLYYRINVIEVKVPPLRDRKDDIPLLAEAFLEEFCEREKKRIALTEEVMGAFQEYHWPGNVRQLRNIIERAVVLNTTRTITLGDLPAEFCLFGENPKPAESRKTLRELELLAIKDALHACNGNKSKAAKLLNISRKAFYKRLNDEENANRASSQSS